MSSSRSETLCEQHYSDKPGKVLFFNYIDGYRQDVIALENKLTDLGWECDHVNVNSVKNLREIQREKGRREGGQGGYPGTIMVFFFGYGYDDTTYDYLFLGTSTVESLSFEVFYHEVKQFQRRGDALILFTGTYFKQPKQNTCKYVSFSECGDVFHSITLINGTCQNGSLVAHVLLNKMEDKTWEICQMASHLNKEINSQKKWGGDEYCHYWKRCGVVGEIFVSFESPSEKKEEKKRKRLNHNIDQPNLK